MCFMTIIIPKSHNVEIREETWEVRRSGKGENIGYSMDSKIEFGT